MKKALFVNEADLCAAFIGYLPEGWKAYPETAGFDILLLREADGAQIGIEAKRTLNAKVLLQASEGLFSSWDGGMNGPDFRAALVPRGTAGAEMKGLARRIGVTVIECNNERHRMEAAERRASMYGNESMRERMLVHFLKEIPKFEPSLPVIGAEDWRRDWVDLLPRERCLVPAYVPDVKAGMPSPVQLSEWKIKAIKIFVILELRGYVTGMDFIEIKINRQRFVQMGWLVPERMSEDGRRSIYKPGKFTPDLRKAHPVNFDQIKTDFPNWATADIKEGMPDAS